MGRQVACSLAAGLMISSLAAAAAADEKAAASPAAAAHAPAPPRRLDLRAPDITELYTPQQIQSLLAKTFAENIEGVEVEGERERLPANTPTVWGGIAAPIWALLNPTQAWRIFAPLPPDQTRGMRNEAPRATDRYLEPAATTFP